MPTGYGAGDAYKPQAANFDPMYGRQDIYDDKGRFIGREGGITREDPMGAQLSNFNKLQGLMENGADGMTGLQALSAQAMGQYNAGAHTMGQATDYVPQAPQPAQTAGQQADAVASTAPAPGTQANDPSNTSRQSGPTQGQSRPNDPVNTSRR